MDVGPDLATSGLPNVALRVPAHPVAQALLRAFEGPLCRAEREPLRADQPDRRARAVRAELGRNCAALILDGGPCAVQVWNRPCSIFPAKISPVLLRARAAYPLEEIRSDLDRSDRTRRAGFDDRPLAPGQLKHHYAPRKPLASGAPRQRKFRSQVPMSAGWLLENRRRSSRMASPGLIGWKIFRPPGDLREAAKSEFFLAPCARAWMMISCVKYAIYANACDYPPARCLGLAINERLERAAG